jgi:hypothetical protein
MSAGIVDHANGVITLKVSGKLTQSELAAVQTAAAGIIRAGGRWSILVLTDNFSGWERGGQWSDFALQSETDDSIEKMAIVGERRWEELALIFTAKGLRPFPIEYFEPAHITEARDWLRSN